MPTARQHLVKVRTIQSDVAAVSTIMRTVDLGLDLTRTALELPGRIEDELRDPANAIRLPAPVVSVLGVLPYGIGTAIHTLDRITDTAADEIARQAGIMAALDRSWAPLHATLDAINVALRPVSLGLEILGARQDRLTAEARLILDSTGAGPLPGQSRLPDLFDGYGDSLKPWLVTRAKLVAPLRDAAAAVDAATRALEALLPSLAPFQAVADQVKELVAPLRNFFVGLEDALNVEFTIIPAIPTPFGTIPAVTVHILSILGSIGSAVAIVQNFVEGIIQDALAALGVDLFAAINALEAQILKPFQPLFDLVATLGNLLRPAIDALLDLLEAVDFGPVREALEAVVTESLFAHSQIGGAADDTLTGGAGEDGLFGADGADRLDGAAGGDFLFGGAGDDSLTGRAGRDELFGGADADSLDGGADGDLLIGGAGADTLSGGTGHDRLDGGGRNDKLFGGAGVDTLSGNDGNDSLYGGGGKDQLFGGGGNDTLRGGSGPDLLVGNAGGDALRGEGGGDTLQGGVGADTLIGGAGADRLAGGGGADRFDFNFANETPVGAGRDRILDFSSDQNDRIDLAGIDASTTAGGNQAFTLITGDFTGVAGELRIAGSGANRVVQGDTDGDGSADFHILVQNVAALSAGDFVL